MKHSTYKKHTATLWIMFGKFEECSYNLHKSTKVLISDVYVIIFGLYLIFFAIRIFADLYFFSDAVSECGEYSQQNDQISLLPCIGKKEEKLGKKLLHF